MRSLIFTKKPSGIRARWQSAKQIKKVASDKSKLLIAALLFVGAGTLFFPTAAIHAQSVSGPIVSGMIGKCLHDHNGSTADYTVIDIYTCNGTGPEIWTMPGDGTIQFKGKCLESDSGYVYDGAPIDLRTCNAGAAQQWEVVGDELVNPGSNMCLTDPGGVTTNGTQLTLEDCVYDATQVWRTPPTNPVWLTNTTQFNMLVGAGASTTLLNASFGNGSSYVFNGPTATPTTTGTPTAVYYDYNAIQSAFTSGVLPGPYKAVLYDNEDWQFTPTDQQQNPDYYEQLTGQLLHAHGMQYIAAPATDIVNATGTLVNGNDRDTFIARNIAGSAARYADVFDIQAQTMETNVSSFSAYVNTVAQQARQANPTVKVLVGLSTGPNGQTITNQQMLAAYNSVWPLADGFWINIPQQSPFCPNCTVAQPQVAVYLLQQVYGMQ